MEAAGAAGFSGPLFMLGGLVLLIILVFVLVRWFSDSRDGPGIHVRTPREILDERVAKGEIERAEYEERKKLLSSS